MNNWKECKLGEVGEVVTGKTPSKNNPEDWGSEIPFVTPTDYKNYKKYAFDSERKLSLSGAKRLSKKLLPLNSILVTCIGSDMGKVVINKIPVVTNQQINSIIPKEDIISYDFLYYQLVNIYDTLRIYGGDGTAVPIVNKSDFESIKIFLPPLPEQKAIASVLSSLDDKIDLLHRQNKTLESMAETLFRKWFVEKKYDSSISQFVYIQNGFAFESKDFIASGTEQIIKIKNIYDGIVDIDNTDYVDIKITENLDKCFKLFSGDILIAMTGAEIGKLGFIPATINSLWLNQRVGLIKEKYLGSKYLAYLQLKSDLGQDYIKNTATGSAQPNISSLAIENCEFPKLTEEEIRNYSLQLIPLFEKIVFNLGQIRTLEKLRDTLLPKLMSGTVRLSNFEEVRVSDFEE
ncbi:MAG: restriction endonuclease subunit S [Candidatus Omnitrophica bacterium]|nr:restriction endonuclease subunit S [Candidatus Omnitrophota bacterium]